MALRKPLVLINGQMQQIAATDTLDAVVSEVDVIQLSNASGSAQSICSPVYISAANAFQLARANASGTTDVVGFVKDASIASNGTGGIQTDGILTATTAQWDAVTGSTGGLTSGTIYFLSSATAGKIVSAAPTATGEYVMRVGKAVSTTALEISFYPPILL